jgi:hypothetical protein
MHKTLSDIRRLLFDCAIALATLIPSEFSLAAEQQIALVIGNSAYPTSRLRNPFNDAKAMAAKLRSLGFKGISPVSHVREAYIQALQRPAVESLARTGGRSGPPAYGLTLMRD